MLIDWEDCTNIGKYEITLVPGYESIWLVKPGLRYIWQSEDGHLSKKTYRTADDAEVTRKYHLGEIKDPVAYNTFKHIQIRNGYLSE